MGCDQIFSSDNLLEYCKACVDIAINMPEREFDGILIPSRGAFPFFIGVAEALSKLGKHYEDFAEFNRSLNIPRVVGNYLVGDGFSSGKGSKNVLLVPFTADLNLERLVRDVDESSFIDFTRKYWSRVTSNFLLQPEERKKDPNFVFFTDFILRKIENREADARAYEQFPQVRKLNMIDTVISGRASSTIIGCLEELAVSEGLPGLFNHADLIIDEVGRKLKSPFKEFLRNRLYTNSPKVSFYNVPRIVSEDEGAALEGVAAVVYPTIMKKSLRLRKGGDMMFIGAGSWRTLAGLGDYEGFFKKFVNLVYRGVEYELTKQGYIESSASDNTLNEKFEWGRRKFIDEVKRTKMLAQRDDFTGLNISLPTDKIYETGSHVVHVLFKDYDADTLMAEFSSRFNDLSYYND